MTKKTRTTGLAVAATLLAAFGLTSLTSAQAAPANARGYCIKVGTGDFKNLWLTPDGKCPIYTPKTDEYWGPVSLGGNGAPGPKGDKGDPGDSRLVITSGVATTAAGTAGNGTLVVSVPGMPPFSATQARRIFVDVNGEVLSPGVMAQAGAPTAAPGAVTWNFPVSIAGQVAATPGQAVRLDVLAVPVA